MRLWHVMLFVEKKDHIDSIIAKWKREKPEYDLAPVEVIGRMGRIMEYVDRALEAKFQEFSLSRASFDVLATLRREGPPYALSQRGLVKSLLRTSGSMSIRIDAMEREGLVRRNSQAEDRRASIVSLTEKGLKLLEQIVPEHLLNETSLLAGLDQPARKELIFLLRRWLVSLEENSQEQTLLRLGIIVVSPHVALQRRRAAGLPDKPGVLVHAVEPGSLGDDAGFRKGDLIVGVGSQDTESFMTLRKALNEPKAKTQVVRVLRGAEPLQLAICSAK
jgi:DNA-binding MarR family transcriptional regulator